MNDQKTFKTIDHAPAPLREAATSKITSLLSNRSALALVDQAVVSGTNFMTSLCVGKLLGKDSLGVFFITFSVFTVLQCIADQLIHSPYLVRAPKFGLRRAKRYAASMLIHNSVLTVVGVVVVILTAIWMFTASQDNAIAPMMLLLAALLPGMLLREFIHNLLHNQLRQREALALDSCVAVLQLASLGVMFWTDTLTLFRVLLSVGVCATLVSLAWMPRVWGRLTWSTRGTRKDFVGNWVIGKWTLGSYLIGSSAPTVLPWFLVYLHGTEATGLLAACLTLVGIALMFLRGVGKYMAPKMAAAFSENGHEALIREIKVFSVQTIAAMTLIAGVLAIGGDFLVRFVYSDEYQGATRIMQVLAIGCWLQALDIVTGCALLAISKADRNFWADCVRFSVTLLLALLLIPSYAALGVAIALVAGMLAGLAFRAYAISAAMRDMRVAVESKPGIA